MNELKACPFCGQIPSADDADFCYPVTRLDQDGRQVWRAGCIDSAGGCGAEVTGWDAIEAINNWNTRAKENAND